MSEAIFNHFRASEQRRKLRESTEPGTQERLAQVDQIRQRLQQWGPKTGALGAVGHHLLSQMESGSISTDEFLQ